MKRKAKSSGKDERLSIRVAGEHKTELARKAQARGLSVSSWLVSLGLAAPEKPSSPGT
jgi:uncharacterized protein (DUF1778 family)